MNIPPMLATCETRPGATVEAVNEVEAELGVQLPDDYKGLVEQSNGLEGFASNDEYIILWQVEDLTKRNSEYGTAEFVPGVILLGTNGSNTGLGFRVKDRRYVTVPLVGMEPSAIVVVGDEVTSLVDHN